MGALFDTIRQRVMNGRYIIGQHAIERLDERGILEWQVVDGIEHGRLLLERPADLPNPAIEALQILADGAEIKAVWSYIIASDIAKLVTVHFLD
jgi:hypothetical protein